MQNHTLCSYITSAVSEKVGISHPVFPQDSPLCC